MFDSPAFAQGLALALGVIACPGPKDLLILRQALGRRPALELLAVGVGSDALLIAVGIAGLAALLAALPSLHRLAVATGAAMLLLHALSAFKRCLHPSSIAEHETGNARRDLVLASFVNPAAWLDTVLIIGTSGATLPVPSQPSFAVGAVSASALWFAALTFGGRALGAWFMRPTARRWLDGCAAASLLGMAGYVAGGLW